MGTGRSKINLDEIPVVKEVEHNGYKIAEYENGSIIVYKQDKMLKEAIPILRKIATALNIPIVNGNGNPHNTRRLGSLVINSLLNGLKPVKLQNVTSRVILIQCNGLDEAALTKRVETLHCS